MVKAFLKPTHLSYMITYTLHPVLLKAGFLFRVVMGRLPATLPYLVLYFKASRLFYRNSRGIKGIFFGSNRDIEDNFSIGNSKKLEIILPLYTFVPAPFVLSESLVSPIFAVENRNALVPASCSNKLTRRRPF